MIVQSRAKAQDRNVDCRIRTRFAFDRHVCYPTSDRKWLSGESRLEWEFGTGLYDCHGRTDVHRK